MKQALLIFVTVVEKQNFSRAAEVLHMTQPAVSQYIQSLERTLGTPLLERSNKFVRLNKAGQIVYHHAKEILTTYSRMQYLIDDLLHVASGTLTIGASYTFGEYVLPHIIAELAVQYPFIKPSISIHNTAEIAELVLGNQIDIGIIEGSLSNDKLYIEAFADDAMYVVGQCEHSLRTQRAISTAALAEQTWIIREIGSGTREAAEKLFAELALQPAKILEFGSTQIIKESVERGLGIALLSQWAINKELVSDKLCILDVPHTPHLRQFSLVTAKSQFHTKATEVFLEVLRCQPILKFGIITGG